VLGARDQVEALVHVGPQLTTLCDQKREGGSEERYVSIYSTKSTDVYI
jgi:hypothetical protein